ncbi:DUF1764-domain-containing protein [Rickenella mellea]|uniref:DUF1764-domain-containing protein n=1 Tax=Rickenella mellea TaxID=50990 RepID=A0A4Y7Q2N2_9AGAM|nr:DUF1764-domain-containing protein [Rickenella mellea]
MPVPAASEIDAIFATGKNGKRSGSITISKPPSSSSPSTSTAKVKTSKVKAPLPPEDSGDSEKRKKKKKRKHAESEVHPASAVDGDAEWLGFSAADSQAASSSRIDSVTSAESPAAPGDGDRKKKKKRKLLAGTELESEQRPAHQQAIEKVKDDNVRTAHLPVVTVVDTSLTLPSAVSGKAGTRKTPVSRLARDGGVSEPKVSAKANGKRKDDDDSRFRDSRGAGPRRHTEDGYAIYKEDELGIGDQGGDTPLCPFDCDCCWQPLRFAPSKAGIHSALGVVRFPELGGIWTFRPTAFDSIAQLPQKPPLALTNITGHDERTPSFEYASWK